MPIAANQCATTEYVLFSMQHHGKHKSVLMNERAAVVET
jgi:hypothetical protein